MVAHKEQGIINESVLVLWLFLPAGMGNIAPILVAKLPVLAAWSFPLDGYATFRGRRILLTGIGFLLLSTGTNPRSTFGLSSALFLL